MWNETADYLVIHILPPFWKTYWFRLLAAFLVAGIVYTVYRNRLNNIKNQNKKLERLVEERTRELYEANEEINTQNEELSEANESLMERGDEITKQRDQLEFQYQKLLDAQKIIEHQNKEILKHNKTLDEEVKARTKELLDYNQQLEQFAFIAAHNLRAPVARILGLGEVLNLVKEEPEQEKQIIQKLIGTTRELDSVVKDMTTILEIRKGNNLAKDKIRIVDHVEKIKGNLAVEIIHSKATVLTDFSVVNEIETIKPYFDSIIYNLLSNAIKYSHPNRLPVIRIASGIESDEIYIKVSDNGLGIDLDLHRDKLFNLYKRFHFHKDGKGMGLHLVKTEIVSMGGRIEVESKVDEGTTFTVFFGKEEA
jgi:signal transduction histidine kinase